MQIVRTRVHDRAIDLLTEPGVNPEYVATELALEAERALFATGVERL